MSTDIWLIKAKKASFNMSTSVDNCEHCLIMSTVLANKICLNQLRTPVHIC